ncbi:uncharacterized protein B0T15DRAFT_526656 [Chaetomium strumarium]|uniref:Uncharacterized protein n=1 Tax=Chaetomium strumarium TaxID=1170767 RepID=A0AAJ0GZX2_9PEZI|nr:hypothetical protein B0T15DRAFT_526656 [Chaetomium strumarium]
MRHLSLTVLFSLLSTTTLVAARPPAPSTTTTTCESSPKPTYQPCGGFRIKPFDCPKGQACIDDPYTGGCGMACDMPGICVDVAASAFCGGFAGIPCKDGRKCVDDPRDECDPDNGGADCGGICV